MDCADFTLHDSSDLFQRGKRHKRRLIHRMNQAWPRQNSLARKGKNNGKEQRERSAKHRGARPHGAIALAMTGNLEAGERN